MEIFDRSSPQSFTVHYNTIKDELRTNIHVSQAFDPINEQPPDKPHQYIGIWDTGATNSVISKKVVSDCHLIPIDMAEVHHVGGTSRCNVYLVSLGLPNQVGIPSLSVTEADFQGDDYDLLIGMDIINRGDFAVTNWENKTVFSFRYPSTTSINFVEEDHARIFSKVGRNDPCPCGSGKKFKKCHGKLIKND